MHLVLNVFIFTRTLVTYARTIFKPRCCLNFQSMHTQAESTYIAHNMFGQIKMEIPWYINRHTLISRKRDGKPRMIDGQFVVVRVGVHQLRQTFQASVEVRLKRLISTAVEMRLKFYRSAAVFRLKIFQPRSVNFNRTVEFNRFNRISTDALSTFSFSCTGAQYSLGC